MNIQYAKETLVFRNIYPKRYNPKSKEEPQSASVQHLRREAWLHAGLHGFCA